MKLFDEHRTLQQKCPIHGVLTKTQLVVCLSTNGERALNYTIVDFNN